VTPSITPSKTPSFTPSISKTPSVTPSITPSPTSDPSPSVVPSPTRTPSISISETPAVTPSVTPSKTVPVAFYSENTTDTGACDGTPGCDNFKFTFTGTATLCLCTGITVSSLSQTCFDADVDPNGFFFISDGTNVREFQRVGTGFTATATDVCAACPNPPSPTPSPSISKTPSRTPSITISPSSPRYSSVVYASLEAIPTVTETVARVYYSINNTTTNTLLGGNISSTSCLSPGTISGLKNGDTLRIGVLSYSNNTPVQFGIMASNGPFINGCTTAGQGTQYCGTMLDYGGKVYTIDDTWNNRPIYIQIQTYVCTQGAKFNNCLGNPVGSTILSYCSFTSPN